MTDRRENILQQLLAIAQTQAVAVAARNRLNVSDKKRPAIVIYDGEETEADPPGQRSHAGDAPKLMTMRPVILIAVGEESASVGSWLNQIRASFLAALVSDETLKTQCTTNGLARYEGCVTEARDGEQTEMVMQIRLALTYPLKVSDLTD